MVCLVCLVWFVWWFVVEFGFGTLAVLWWFELLGALLCLVCLVFLVSFQLRCFVCLCFLGGVVDMQVSKYLKT